MPAKKPIGIRLERKKDASLLNWNLKRPYPPEKIRVPVPSDSLPCVRAGEAVQAGQKIAEAKGREGVSVHAGISGVVEKISIFPDPLGSESLMIEIRRHGGPNTSQFPKSGNWGSPDRHKAKEDKGRGEPKALPPAEMRKGWEQIPKKELLWTFQHSGLVTTDPRMEPVHVKLERHAGARTIIVNGCEPEPYITCEQILTMSHPVEILKGAELLKKITGAEKILFAFESSNLEMIELIKSKIYFLKWEFAEVRTVPALYPQGLESTLLQAWFPENEDETIVFPASTAFAVYEAVALGKPFYERVVTVGGECVVEPRSLWLPLGISFHDAIHACKGVMRAPEKVLMGGPMAGIAQATEEVPVMAGTSAILALPGEVVKEEPPVPIPINRSGAEIGAAQTTFFEKNQQVWAEPCIRCSRCAEKCPASLLPAMISLAAEKKEFAVAEAWGASQCIECGNCAYVCPSKRPMLELIRLVCDRSKKAVPILIHCSEAEIGAVPTTVNQKKIKVGTAAHA